MKDTILLAGTFVSGIFCLVYGAMGRKVTHKRQAAGVLLIMGYFNVAEFVSALAVYLFRPSHVWISKISEVQFFTGGVMLGIFLTMLVCGHFDILQRKSGSSDFKKGDL